MNDPLARNVRRLAAFCALAFLLLTAATFYWGFVRAEELAARPDNERRIAFDRRIRRGRILDRAGRVLAETVDHVTEDGKSLPRRVYPVPAAAPVVGFQTWRYGAGGDSDVTYGSGGAEAAYDRALRGDMWMGLRHLIGSRVLGRPQQGRDVVLTLDAELQQFAADQLGGREGAAVVVDIDSGAIRALVSQPTFDPAQLDAGIAPDDDAVNPMLNRATQGLYPPGSTWKAVTLASALNEGTTRLDEVVNDGERTEYFDGFPVRCDNNPPGRNTFDVAHAFGWSCNVTFARLGTDLGERTVRTYADAFGVAETIPFPLPVAPSSLSNDDDMSPAELASASFGQGEVLVTPLHMALVTTALAGNGTMPVPYLLESVPSVRWSTMADDRGTWRQSVSRATANEMRKALVISATDGWARTVRADTGVSAGGKTGTAQVADGEPHSWFIGFAPADEPLVAVAVVVPHGGEGSAVAAPMAGRILHRALELEATYGEASSRLRPQTRAAGQLASIEAAR